jgi:hypothetical protein
VVDFSNIAICDLSQTIAIFYKFLSIPNGLGEFLKKSAGCGKNLFVKRASRILARA